MRTYFFLVGCGRSGTTLLQQALNRHSRIVIPPESAFFTALGLERRAQQDRLKRINGDWEIKAPLPDRPIRCTRQARNLYEEMARLYLDRLDRPMVSHFGEKTPEHQRRLARIRRLFPAAKVILLYRDGRDVACRLRRLPWMSPDLYVNFALWLHYYRLQQRAQHMPGLHLLCVRYEDLVTAPEEELRKVLAFLGLPYEPQVAEGYGNTEGIPGWEYPWKARALEPISSARVGLWRNELTTEQVGILERWGGAALRGLGYELATGQRRPLPWWFLPQVYGNSLLWLAQRRPSAAALNWLG
jgi:hypothetical protein